MTSQLDTPNYECQTYFSFVIAGAAPTATRWSIPYYRCDGGIHMAGVNIEIRENGPLRITGPVTITDKDGKEYSIPEGQWASLCRCGESGNKPFCDSAHRDAGFEAESSAH